MCVAPQPCCIATLLPSSPDAPPHRRTAAPDTPAVPAAAGAVNHAEVDQPATEPVPVPSNVMYWGVRLPSLGGPPDSVGEMVGQPIPLTGTLPFATITVSIGFACGLAANRTAYCLGECARAGTEEC